MINQEKSVLLHICLLQYYCIVSALVIALKWRFIEFWYLMPWVCWDLVIVYPISSVKTVFWIWSSKSDTCKNHANWRFHGAFFKLILNFIFTKMWKYILVGDVDSNSIQCYWVLFENRIVIAVSFTFKLWLVKLEIR